MAEGGRPPPKMEGYTDEEWEELCRQNPNLRQLVEGIFVDASEFAQRPRADDPGYADWCRRYRDPGMADEINQINEKFLASQPGTRFSRRRNALRPTFCFPAPGELINDRGIGITEEEVLAESGWERCLPWPTPSEVPATPVGDPVLDDPGFGEEFAGYSGLIVPVIHITPPDDDNQVQAQYDDSGLPLEASLLESSNQTRGNESGIPFEVEIIEPFDSNNSNYTCQWGDVASE